MDGIHQSCQSLFGGLQGFVAEVHRAAVVCLQGEEADGHRRVGLFQQGVRAVEQLFEGDEVSVALAHLLPVDGEHVVVHPVVYHVIALACHSLCYLAFVVGEDEIHASAVYVEVVAQVFLSHGGTFAVPSGIRRSRAKASA